MAGTNGTASRVTVWTAVAALLASLGLALGFSSPAAADTAPSDPATTTTVSADALPTAQMNGVAWTQVIIGTTVFVGGNFTRARPPGAAAGTSESPRTNLMAYDLTTGALLPFAPVLNGQVMGLAASPDGSRLYVAGEFTTIDGQNRYRIAAFDTAGLTLNPSFRPTVDYRVKAVVATATTVYIGGAFNSVGGASRTRLAALNASNGALLNWAPTATGGQVLGMVLSPGLNKIVVAGQFDALNGVQAWGSGALDATTGSTLAWPANTVITNRGSNAGVYSLSTDGTQVYGTGYNFSGTGTLEGSFAASFATGQVVWANGCRGDTYSSYPMNGVLYSVGHPHDCSAIGGHPQVNPWTFQYELATTTGAAADGRVNTSGSFRNLPAPELLHFLPTLMPGTFTGQNQSAWSVSGNGTYMTLAGEFTKVNGVFQQGLTRMAVRSVAPNLQGPQGASELALAGQGIAPGTVRFTWKAAWDRDNRRLTYQLLRDSVVVRSMTADNAWWNRGTLALTDSTATPGSTPTYRLRILDPLGNGVSSANLVVPVPGGTTTSLGYAPAVQGDGATRYWRFGESSGVARDWASADDLTVGSAQRAVTGALTGDSDGAVTFTGGNGVPATTTTSAAGPQTFSLEAWIRTTTTSGGKIVGFGNSSTGSSGTADRHVYMTNSGQLVFGVNPGSIRTVTSPNRYNDGAWHHVVASLGAAGMTLSVDGAAVANRTDTTSAQSYTGFWRVGGDAIGSAWPTRPTNANFVGSVDDVAVYPTALDAAAVGRHWTLGRGVVPNFPPTASFLTTASGLTASVNASGSADADGTLVGYAWNFGDGGTATGPTASHAYAAAGTYTVTLVVTDDDGATGSTTRQVTVTAPPANAAPVARFTSTTGNLAVQVDGTTSTDADGTVASWAWTFGDGGTATGSTASHAYAAAGSYPVTLTVRDDDGATNVVSATVVVSGDLANDTFTRSVTGGLGTADVGGAWTVASGASSTSVAGGLGRLGLPTAGATRTAVLTGVQSTDTRTELVMSLDGTQTGGGTIVSVIGRRVGAGSDYRVKLRYYAGGAVTAQLVRAQGSAETVLSSATVPGLSYAPGEAVRVRLDVSGTGTTALAATVWRDGAAVPATPLVTATDTTAAFQAAGAVGVLGYLSTTSTVVPMTLSIDSFTARPTGNG